MNKVLWIGLWCCGIVYVCWLAYVRLKRKKYTRFGSGEMFDSMAHYYDGMNRVISLGLDMSWRQYAVRHLVHLPLHSRVLDVAVGTGDLSLCLLRQRPDYQVVGIDPSVEMLQRAKRKLSGCSSSAVVLEKGEAEQLPFADGSFDAVMVAFGVRNFRDRKQGILEMARVLRNDDNLGGCPGKLLIMELTTRTNNDESYRSGGRAVLHRIAQLFIRYVVPCLGLWLTGSRYEYHYLQQSMQSFPDATTFQQFLQRECGLSIVAYERCLWGLGPDIYVLTKKSHHQQQLGNA